jgi:hypothetical protein
MSADTKTAPGAPTQTPETTSAERPFIGATATAAATVLDKGKPLTTLVP